jgi:very-short-patch-repair endonuclease
MFQTLLPLFVIAIIIVALGAALKVLRTSRRSSAEECPYLRADLFSPAERSFLGVLDQAVAGRYRVMGKVRLADVIKVERAQAQGGRQSAWNRIQSKHLDFVLCDPATLAVAFVVELDDKSHKQSNRKSRDEFVDRALAAAGIRVVHMPAMAGYSVENIRKALMTNEPA